MNVVFIGSKTIGYCCMRACEEVAPNTIRAILTLQDTDDSRSAYSDFSRFVRDRNIPLHLYKKSSDLDEFITKNKAELCIVVGWYWIIKKEVLDKVPYGFVGLHGSLLPKYRGGSPLVWSIINGDTETGVSLFYFADGLDNGDIIAQAGFNIKKEDTIKEVSDKATECATIIFKEYYPRLLQGNAPRTHQDEQQATYVPMRKPDDGLINWTWSPKRIQDFIRAQTKPYPGAFTYVRDRKVIIWNAEVK